PTTCPAAPRRRGSITPARGARRWGWPCRKTGLSPLSKSGRATNTNVILRSSARSAERLEGWQQTRCVFPSFETAARRGERPPQDDGCVCCAARRRLSNRLQVGVLALVKIVVGVAHGLRLAAPEHHLKIDRFQAVVLVAVDHAGRRGDALRWAEPGGEARAAVVLDEGVEMPLEREEKLVDQVGVRGVDLSGRPVHDRQGEILRRDDGGIAVLARAAGADETVLGALVALDLGVLE